VVRNGNVRSGGNFFDLVVKYIYRSYFNDSINSIYKVRTPFGFSTFFGFTLAVILGHRVIRLKVL